LLSVQLRFVEFFLSTRKLNFSVSVFSIWSSIHVYCISFPQFMPNLSSPYKIGFIKARFPYDRPFAIVWVTCPYDRPDRLDIFLRQLGRSGRSGQSYGKRSFRTKSLSVFRSWHCYFNVYFQSCPLYHSSWTLAVSSTVGKTSS